MSRRKRAFDPVHGWLVLDKPQAMTSTDAVNRVKRLFNSGKAGHAGTLDPLASGVLPIAFGEATKTVPFVMDGRKSYRFTVRWGAETDTDDAEGRTVGTADRRPEAREIAAVLPAFSGEIFQVPPRFSAIKIGGERAYDLAREGEIVELGPRPVTVHRLELVETPDGDTSILACECGKGTYVRALARDIGRRLGTFGHVAQLRRTRVGPFDEAQAVTFERIEAARAAEDPKAALAALLQPIAAALADVPHVAVGRDAAARLRRGQPVILRGRDAPPHGAVWASEGGDLVAIGEAIEGAFHPKRVFDLRD